MAVVLFILEVAYAFLNLIFATALYSDELLG